MENEKYKSELKVLIMNGGAILSAYLIKRLTEVILESVFHKQVPDNPEENEDIGWIEALGWAAFTGALAGAIKLVIKRGTKVSLEKIM